MEKYYELLDALDSVVWYNGLYDQLKHWQELLMMAKADRTHLLRPIFPEDLREQLEIFWMLLVCLYGDYGTSPRSGWIEELDHAHDFIDEMCVTSKWSEEHGQI